MTPTEFWYAQRYVADAISETKGYKALQNERERLVKAVNEIQSQIRTTSEELSSIVDDGRLETLHRKEKLQEALKDLRYQLDTGAKAALATFDTAFPEQVKQLRATYKAEHAKELIALASEFEAKHSEFLAFVDDTFRRWNTITTTCGNGMSVLVVQPEHLNIEHGLFSPALWLMKNDAKGVQ